MEAGVWRHHRPLLRIRGGGLAAGGGNRNGVGEMHRSGRPARNPTAPQPHSVSPAAPTPPAASAANTRIAHRHGVPAAGRHLTGDTARATHVADAPAGPLGAPPSIAVRIHGESGASME